MVVVVCVCCTVPPLLAGAAKEMLVFEPQLYLPLFLRRLDFCLLVGKWKRNRFPSLSFNLYY